MKFNRRVYIVATFFLALFLITANAYAAKFNLDVGPNGSIDITDVNGDLLADDATGSSSVIFANIKEATFTMTPEASFQVADVLLDGNSIGAVVSYYWEKPEPDPLGTHTFDVTFAPIPVVASFVTDLPSGTEAGVSVQFTDTSENGPSTWTWDFVDVNDATNTSTSTVQNPAHTFAPGTYNVTLTVTNAQNGTTNSVTQEYIAVQPTIAYQASAVGNGTIDPSGYFTEYEGVGTTFTITPNELYQVADVVVETPGLAPESRGPVTSLTFDGTTDIADHTITASFEPIPVAAIFSANMASGAITTTDVVEFTDGSQGDQLSWSWVFDGGNGNISTSTAQNPEFTFTQAGDYTVTLTVTNTATSNSVSEDFTVNDSSGPVVRDDGASSQGYDYLQDAYDDIAVSETIKIKASVPIKENLIFSRNVTVILQGGYDDDFVGVTGFSRIQGNVTISDGTVEVSKVIISSL